MRNYDKEFVENYGLVIKMILDKGIKYDKATDLAQDCYIRFKTSCNNGLVFNSGAELRRYLNKVVHAVVIDDWRRRQIRFDIEKGDSSYDDMGDSLMYLSDGHNPERTYQGKETLDMVYKTVDNMCDGWKETFHKRFIEEKSFKQITKEGGKSQNTYLGHIRYVRQRLKQHKELTI